MDNNTILIRHPSQYEAILQTYTRHADTSEASINEDKTQIFRLGNPHQEKIKEKVKILGAIFCKNREERDPGKSCKTNSKNPANERK